MSSEISRQSHGTGKITQPVLASLFAELIVQLDYYMDAEAKSSSVTSLLDLARTAVDTCLDRYKAPELVAEQVFNLVHQACMVASDNATVFRTHRPLQEQVETAIKVMREWTNEGVPSTPTHGTASGRMATVTAPITGHASGGSPSNIVYASVNGEPISGANSSGGPAGDAGTILDLMARLQSAQASIAELTQRLAAATAASAEVEENRRKFEMEKYGSTYIIPPDDGADLGEYYSRVISDLANIFGHRPPEEPFNLSPEWASMNRHIEGIKLDLDSLEEQEAFTEGWERMTHSDAVEVANDLVWSEWAELTEQEQRRRWEERDVPERFDTGYSQEALVEYLTENDEVTRYVIIQGSIYFLPKE